MLSPFILFFPAECPNALLYVPNWFSDKADCPTIQLDGLSPPPTPTVSPLIFASLVTFKLPSIVTVFEISKLPIICVLPEIITSLKYMVPSCEKSPPPCVVLPVVFKLPRIFILPVNNELPKTLKLESPYSGPTETRSPLIEKIKFSVLLKS